MVCEVYLDALNAGVLQRSQLDATQAAETLIRGLARVGIIALVDEATGYREVRARQELQKILEAYVQAEFRPWVQTFPDEFFREIYRLHDWEFWPGTSRRTPHVGKLIKHYIYEVCPDGHGLRVVGTKDALGVGEDTVQECDGIPRAPGVTAWPMTAHSRARRARRKDLPRCPHRDPTAMKFGAAVSSSVEIVIRAHATRPVGHLRPEALQVGPGDRLPWSRQTPVQQRLLTSAEGFAQL